MSFVLALDQGTTSCRAILFDREGVIRSIAQREFTQYFPRPGWVEHDPEEIWQVQLAVAQQALSQLNLRPQDLAAIGIANQRETTVIWDRRTGKPIHNAIVWQDRRTSQFCEDLVREGLADLIQAKTGLIIDAYFSASKIRWLLDQVPDARRQAESGDLAFGTIDSWLLWKLSGGRLHLTDPGNASRTMLFNLKACDWDQELLSLFKIPRRLLPEVRPSSNLFGQTDQALFGTLVPVSGIAGDQQAALFGQNCFSSGKAKNTYGTGCFLLMNTGQKAVTSRHRLLATIAWNVDGQTDYALEGSVFVAGAAVQWLRDGLGIIKSPSEVETLAATTPDNGGVYLVPAFTGLGAPHWDPFARGTIVGLTRGTTTAHIARATLEGIAFQVADVIQAMHEDCGTPLTELRVDGGACANDLLMQFQADILQVPVARPALVETTAWGAATLAGLAVGFWPDRAALESVWRLDRYFQPRMSADEATHRRTKWKLALARSSGWEKP